MHDECRTASIGDCSRLAPKVGQHGGSGLSTSPPGAGADRQCIGLWLRSSSRDNSAELIPGHLLLPNQQMEKHLEIVPSQLPWTRRGGSGGETRQGWGGREVLAAIRKSTTVTGKEKPGVSCELQSLGGMVIAPVEKAPRSRHVMTPETVCAASGGLGRLLAWAGVGPSHRQGQLRVTLMGSDEAKTSQNRKP